MRAFRLALFLSCFGLFSRGVIACSIVANPVPYADSVASLRDGVLHDQLIAGEAIYLATLLTKTISAEELPMAYGLGRKYFGSRYEFQVLATLKGPEIKSFAYKSPNPGENFLAAPIVSEDGETEVDDERSVILNYDVYASDKHLSFDFWQYGRLAIGDMTSAGDCRDYVTFESDVAYLFVLDAEGRTISAERIPAPDDLWLRTVLQYVAKPQDEELGNVSLQQIFLTYYTYMEEITVDRCGPSPKIILQDVVSKQVYEEIPAKLYRGVTDLDPYSEYPFDQKACTRGARFLRLGLQWFPIANDDVVDFTELRFPVALIGARTASLDDISRWIAYRQGG